MVFYFGFAVLCVFFLYFVHILWYFSPCRKIWGNLTGCWRLISVVLMFFCFLSFPPWCNVIGSDLFFFCKSNYGSKCGCKTYYFLFFLFVSPLQYLSSSPLLCLILLCWNSPIWNHSLHFKLSLSIFSNTDNLWIILSHSWHRKACQNGFAQHLEHLLFYGANTSSQNASGNSALHISALYNKASMETDRIWYIYYHNYYAVFYKHFDLSEWAGKLCPRSAVQGSK